MPIRRYIFKRDFGRFYRMFQVCSAYGFVFSCVHTGDTLKVEAVVNFWEAYDMEGLN